MGKVQVYIVDDDPAVRDALGVLLRSRGLRVRSFASGQEFLDASPPLQGACLLLDLRMPGLSGLDVQASLAEHGHDVPIVFLTGHGDVPASARAFKGGAVDFLEKPVDEERLLASVHEALERASSVEREHAQREMIEARLHRLTPREREVMELVVSGLSNKAIARRLDLSHRTIEAHRARVMEKMEAESLLALADMASVCGLATPSPSTT